MICSEVVSEDHLRAKQYRSCGRVCGMALYHGYLLGAPLSHCFLRLLLDQPPENVSDLQAELNLEQEGNAADFRGTDAFLERTLSEIGLADTLTFSRQLSTKPEVEVDLKPGGSEEVVTNESKEEWLQQTLHHKLVGSIEAQAKAFRNGVLDVVPNQALELLYPNELQEMWSGVGLDDDMVGRWQELAHVDSELGPCADWFWEIIAEVRTATQRSVSPLLRRY